MINTFLENNWIENHNIYCSACNKLTYMGYTKYPTDMHCVCFNSDSIPKYTNKTRLQTLKKEVEQARKGYLTNLYK